MRTPCSPATTYVAHQDFPGTHAHQPCPGHPVEPCYTVVQETYVVVMTVAGLSDVSQGAYLYTLRFSGGLPNVFLVAYPSFLTVPYYC